MNPYSHLYIAAQLEKDLQPTNLAEYYWGAIAPDVRYVARVHREQTHLPPEQIAAFFEKYPHLESFIQGYLVHRFTDLLDLRAFLRQRVLFWPFTFMNAKRLIPVIVETYYIETTHLEVTLSGTPNEILRELKISDEQAKTWAATVQPFLSAPSFETALEFLQRMKNGNTKIDQYLNAANLIDQFRLVKPILFALADMEKLNAQCIAELKKPEIFDLIRRHG
jgi:hypothetical protein